MSLASLFSLVKLLAVPAALGAGAFYYATRIETRSFKLETVSITTGGANPEANRQCRLRVLHLSDLHLCYPEKEKLKFLNELAQEDFDLVVLTGDIFENFSGLAYTGSILSRKPRFGAFAVLGNHDYYNYTLLNKSLGRLFRNFRHPAQKRDVTPMVRALEASGIRVLRNESVTLEDAAVHIVGVDYPYVHPDELNRLVAKAPPGHLKVVLFHLPVNMEHISESGAQVAFGGHTHGGQVRFPGIGAIITDSELPRHEASGVLFRGQTAFHISRGLGADPRTNIRLFCPPAATIVEVF